MSKTNLYLYDRNFQINIISNKIRLKCIWDKEKADCKKKQINIKI